MTTAITVPAPGGGPRAWILLVLVFLARIYRAFLLTLVVTAVIPAAWSWHGYVVRSGSMEPGISRGDVVAAAPFTRAETMPIGRVMIFANPARPQDRTPLVHRVMSDDGNGMFTTKGDANRADDTAPVPRDNFHGRAVLLTPFVGLPLIWARTGAVVPLAGWILLTAAALYGAGAPGRQKRRADRPGDPRAGAGGPARAGRRPPRLWPRRGPRTRGITAAAATVATAVAAVVAGPTMAAFSARTTDPGNSWAVRVVPALVLSSAPVKPGTSSAGTLSRFVGGESLRYRLDAPGGTELTGSLAGSPTPAVIPAAGGGSVVVTVPVGTSDGPHTVYAVASPSGASASAGIVVDGTAPPVPVLTLTPTAVSGDAATFAFTESEASATVECTLDGAAYDTCSSPTVFTALAAGSHTFQARATDTVGNVSASVSYTWTVNLSVPTVGIDFPTMSGQYNDSSFTADCGTALIGDVCGSADDDVAVTAVSVSLRRASTGLWWNGSTFSAATETFLAAVGTIDWTYALAPTALAEGDYTLRARASDGANLGFDSRTFTIDRTAPPTPTLTTAPPATSGPSATFAFADADPTAGFECRLDAGGWIPCSSPQVYGNLANGSHSVNVRAVDGAGNASAGTATTWTVDATAPTAALTFPVATSYNLAGWAAGCGTPDGDVCGTASDIGSGLAAVAVSIRQTSTHSYWDGSAFAAASETWLGATGTATWSRAFAGTAFPADGGYTVRWRATDAVGNVSTGGVDLTLDATPPPAPQIVRTPSDPSGTSAQFDFTDAEAGTGAQCRMDAGAWAVCVAPVSFSGLAAGSHTFNVRATDAAGNVSAPVSYTWTVTVGLPIVDITFPDPGRSYNNTTFAAGCGTPAGDFCGIASDPQASVSSVGVSIRSAATSLYWNGTTFGSATEVFLAATGTTSWSYAMAAASFPVEGGYTLHARATNSVGLTGFDTLTITVDRTAPGAPTITAGPTGTTAGNDSFSFTGEAGATFECRLDAGSWAACTSPKTYGALADGPHTFSVRATDSAGNTGATTSRAWTIDATPPNVAITFPVAGAAYSNTSWKTGCVAATDDLCGTATDAGGTVSLVEVAIRRSSTGLYWNGTAFTASAPTWVAATGTASWSLPFAATAFPAADTYVLSVRATDASGSVSTPTDTTFVIDRTGPGAASLAAINLGTIVRRIETGDRLTLTFTEAIAPASLIAGWNGTGSQNIVIRQANGSNDQLSFYNTTNTARLPLGLVQMKRSDYVSAAVVWGATSTRSTLSLSGNTVTITFGTPDNPAKVSTAAAAANMSWSPRNGVSAGTGITDLAGNLGTSTARAETDLDSDF